MRFSLRTLLLVMLAVALACGIFRFVCEPTTQKEFGYCGIESRHTDAGLIVVDGVRFHVVVFWPEHIYYIPE